MISVTEPLSMGEIAGSLINSRWRHKGTGDVIVVRQVHRADRIADVEVERGWQTSVGFQALAADYEILLPVMR